MLKKELIEYIYIDEEKFWNLVQLFLISRQYLMTVYSIAKYAFFIQNKLCNQLISQYEIDPDRIYKYRFILNDNTIFDYMSGLNEETDAYEIQLIQRIKDTYIRLKKAFLPSK